MKAKKVWFDSDFIHVETTENEIGKMPLNWFPSFFNASKEAIDKFELWAGNTRIHWESLDEDLSVEGFFNYKGKNSTVS